MLEAKKQSKKKDTEEVDARWRQAREQEAAAKARLDDATAILAAQSLGRGMSEPEKTLDLGTDKDDTAKHDEKVGLNQLSANIAEEFDKTSVQTNPAVVDIIKRNLGKLFGTVCLGAADGAKGVEPKVPDDDTEDDEVPAPTSPKPPAVPTLQPSEQQRAAELARNATTPAAAAAAAVASAPAATHLLEQQLQQAHQQQ